MLHRFFIYDPRIAKSEDTEHEKILFFFPDTLTLDEKQSHIGLAQALVGFSQTFSPDKPADTVHTDKTRHYVFECEPSVWMVLIVKNPFTVRTGKDGKSIEEAGPPQYCDTIMRQVLRNAFRLYRMFNGPLETTLKHSSVDALRQKLSMFFVPYLSCLQVDGADLASAFDGVRYFPLDKRLFLSIQSLNHIATTTFPHLRCSMCVFHDHLVWTSMENQDDMRVLFSYVVAHINLANQSLDDSRRVWQPDVRPLFGSASRAFVLPLEECAQNASAAISAIPLIPLVYLNEAREVCHLCVFRRRKLVWICLIEERKHVDVHYVKALAEFLCPQIRILDEAVSEQDLRMQSMEEPYRYMYFNHMNLALKNTVRGKQASITRDSMMLLSEMHEDFTERGGGGDTGEIYIRTHNDTWVVGLQSNGREFFVVSDQKNLNLQQIHEEITRMIAHYFNNVYME